MTYDSYQKRWKHLEELFIRKLGGIVENLRSFYTIMFKENMKHLFRQKHES